MDTIKVARSRLLSRYRALRKVDRAGNVVARDIVALWIGSEPCPFGTLLIVRGIDLEDRLCLLSTRWIRSANLWAFKSLFAEFDGWKLPQDRRLLVIIDDSEGLRQALTDFDARAIIQPCLRTLVQGVVDELPLHAQAEYRERLEAAYKHPDAARAREQLVALIGELRPRHKDAADKLHDSFDASLTVKRFALHEEMEAFLSRVTHFGADPSHDTESRVAKAFAQCFDRRKGGRRIEELQRLAALLSDASR